MNDLSIQRFEIQLEKVEKLFAKAKRFNSPALWLLENDLRTPFFQLEGLARLYTQAYKNKFFKKLLKKSKNVEDRLGELDYFKWLLIEYKKFPNIPEKITNHIAKQYDKTLSQFNKELKKEDWLNGNRIEKIRIKLNKVEWKSEREELILFQNVYQKEIADINSFMAKSNFSFSDMEIEVHELRRKIRWLSIYPQALNGYVKLIQNKEFEKRLSFYATEEIVKSKYNKLTASRNYTLFLQINKPNFYALSWLIFELGKIKDNGLLIDALEHLSIKLLNQNQGLANKNTYIMLGKDYPRKSVLLRNASRIAKKFYDNVVLDNLIVH